MVGLLLLAVGWALGLVFFLIGTIRRRMTARWTRTTGVVTTRDGALVGSTSIYPTFMWQDQHGQWQRHTSNVKQSLGPRPGTQVPVLYDPDATHRGVIDSSVQNGRLFTVLGVGIAALMTLIGLMIVVVSATTTL